MEYLLALKTLGYVGQAMFLGTVIVLTPQAVLAIEIALKRKAKKK
jgi:hypothetical protein